MSQKPVWVDGLSRICAEDLNSIADTIWDGLCAASSPEEVRACLELVPTPSIGGPYALENGQWVQGEWVHVPQNKVDSRIAIEGETRWLLTELPVGDVLIAVNGSILSPTDYSVSANVVTFASPLGSGAKLVAWYAQSM